MHAPQVAENITLDKNNNEIRNLFDSTKTSIIHPNSASQIQVYFKLQLDPLIHKSFPSENTAVSNCKEPAIFT